MIDLESVAEQNRHSKKEEEENWQVEEMLWFEGKLFR